MMKTAFKPLKGVLNRFSGSQEKKASAPHTTYLGKKIAPIPQGLPKKTASLCPECKKVIPATIEDDGGKVVMRKYCPEHGNFEDVVFSDTELYLEVEKWTFGDGRGVSNPGVIGAVHCPHDCGLCDQHASHTSMANIDLTNRCNLKCPICFANANVQGYVAEPTFEEVVGMMRTLRAQRPVPCQFIQFSGGEPTMHPDWFRILKKAKEMGFSHIQAATNGIKFANLEFAQKSAEAGLHTLYLQFDGLNDDIYRATRGVPLLDIKMRAIENCRKAGLHIVFVPTIVKGWNDNQIGDIVRLAVKNVDIVTGISFQPVAFTGRISKEERERQRFTLADMAHEVSKQTGWTDPHRDWLPLASISAFSNLQSALKGAPATSFTCHPHCSIGTFLFVDPDGNPTPIMEFLDLKNMLKEVNELAGKVKATRFKSYTKVKAFFALKKYFNADKAPKGLTFERFLASIDGYRDKKYARGKEYGHKYTYPTVFVAGMHFMDDYNYDLSRVQRCVIHYSAPNGFLYPFCSYNAGPTHRQKVEAAINKKAL